jgi:hypothetical protein
MYVYVYYTLDGANDTMTCCVLSQHCYSFASITVSLVGFRVLGFVGACRSAHGELFELNNTLSPATSASPERASERASD